MEDNSGIARTAVRSAAWSYATFVGSKGLVFITTVILARLLTPEDFGLLALGMLAINYLDTLDDLGVADALIYHQKDPLRTLNAAFLLNTLSATIVTLIAYFGAPLVAEFFHEPRVTDIVRALSFVFVLASTGHLLEARLRKGLDFRSRFGIEVTKGLLKGGISILFAIMGFGVWSLVWGQLLGAAAGTLLYWIKSRWIPRLIFDPEITRSLIGYGWQMTLVSILGMIHKNIDYLIVGYRMDAVQLGYYTMGFRLPELIIISFCQVVAQIMFPTYAKMQDKIDVLRAGYAKTLRYVSLVTVPAGIGVFMIASDFVHVFYTERWAPAIPVVQTLAIYALIYSLSYNAGDIYKATGRPDLLNKISIIKLLITLPALWIAASYNIFYVALAQLLTTVILTLIRLWIASRVIGLEFLKILAAFWPSFLAAGAMLLGNFALGFMLTDFPALTRMFITIAVGIFLYTITFWLVDREFLLQAVSILVRSLRGADPKPTPVQSTARGVDGDSL